MNTFLGFQGTEHPRRWACARSEETREKLPQMMNKYASQRNEPNITLACRSAKGMICGTQLADWYKNSIGTYLVNTVVPCFRAFEVIGLQLRCARGKTAATSRLSSGHQFSNKLHASTLAINIHTHCAYKETNTHASRTTRVTTADHRSPRRQTNVNDIPRLRVAIIVGSRNSSGRRFDTILGTAVPLRILEGFKSSTKHTQLPKQQQHHQQPARPRTWSIVDTAKGEKKHQAFVQPDGFGKNH